MTDNEIIKALECCSKYPEEQDCSECPLNSRGADCLDFELGKFVLDLINRQKAEIERLKTHLEELADEVEDKMTYMCGCKNCIKTVKRIIKDDVKPFDMYCDSCNRCKHREAEAVKEFAKRLKEKAVDVGICDAQGNGYGGATVILIGDIDNLEKEMVGEG